MQSVPYHEKLTTYLLLKALFCYNITTTILATLYKTSIRKRMLKRFTKGSLFNEVAQPCGVTY